MLNLCDKNYIIVGASSGIGKNVAKFLTENCGANVILVARREDIITKMAYELKGDNFAIKYDLEDLENIEYIFEICHKNGYKLDGMVYSAGVSPLFNIAENDVKLMEKVMKVNVLAFVELGKYMLNDKYSNKGASIVAISSIVSLLTTNRQSVYAASKAMLNTYVRYLAKEAIGKMRVNAILPGVVETEMYLELKQKSQNLDEKTKQNQPLGIIPVEKISKMVLYLLSDDASYITGSLFNMDGGYLIR